MAERSSQQRKQPSKRISRKQNPTTIAPEQSANENVNTEEMTPDNIIHLQRTMGNQYVLNMMQRKQNPNVNGTSQTKNNGTIQRAGGTRSVIDQEHTIDDPGINDMVGLVGDWMGTDPTQGLNITNTGDNGTGNGLTGVGTSDTMGTVASVGSILTGTVGTGMGVFNLVQNARQHKDANEKLKIANADYKSNMPGHEELFATVELLKRQKSDAIKGEIENTGNIIGGISGIVNGIGGLLSGATAALVAGVAFGVGAGLNALIGTVSAIRDFVSAGKRAKTKKEVSKLRQVYESLAEPYINNLKDLHQENDTDYNKSEDLTTEVRQLRADVVAKSGEVVKANEELDEEQQKQDPDNDKIDQLQQKITRLQREKAAIEQQADDKEQEARDLLQQITDRKTDIEENEKGYDEYGRMAVALKTAERKQGFGGKIGSGVINLVGAAGGAALLAATLGAGAAAGPVGWILSAVALIGLMSYAIGMHVKRKIRDSNVIRMRAERIQVKDYIKDGVAPPNADPNFVVGANEMARSKELWYRNMFDVPKKGWFNKLISKSRSGKLTMGERLTMLDEYLGKYDKEEQGKVIADGFIAVLMDVDGKGSKKVANPSYVDGVTDPSKQEVEMIELHRGMLAHFFGSKAGEMEKSLTSTTGSKQDKAKELLIKKLKLGG